MLQESQKQENEDSKFSEFKKLKKEIQEKREEVAATEAAQSERGEVFVNEAGPEGNDDDKSTVTRKTIQSSKRGGAAPSQKTEKTEMKSESKKIKSSPNQNVKSANRLIGQQK